MVDVSVATTGVGDETWRSRRGGGRDGAGAGAAPPPVAVAPTEGTTPPPLGPAANEASVLPAGTALALLVLPRRPWLVATPAPPQLRAFPSVGGCAGGRAPLLYRTPASAAFVLASERSVAAPVLLCALPARREAAAAAAADVADWLRLRRSTAA